MFTKLEDAPRQFSARHGVWFSQYLAGNFDTAGTIAQQLVTLAKGQDDAGLELAAHRSLGYILSHRRELEAARLQLDQVTGSYDPDIHGGYAFRHGGADPGAGSLTFGAFVLWALGYPQQSIERTEQALATSQRLGHPLAKYGAFWQARLIDSSGEKATPRWRVHRSPPQLRSSRDWPPSPKGLPKWAEAIDTNPTRS